MIPSRTAQSIQITFPYKIFNDRPFIQKKERSMIKRGFNDP